MTFLVTFDVSPKAELGDQLLLRAKVRRYVGPAPPLGGVLPILILTSCAPTSVPSENGILETQKTSFQLALPVKYAVYTVISRYIPWTSGWFFFT